MPQTTEQFLKSLAPSLGATEADISALISNPAFAKFQGQFDSIVKRGTDDYSAMEGRARQAQEVVAQNQRWYAENNPKLLQAQQEAAAYRAQLEAVDGRPPIDTSKFVTHDDVLRQLEQQNFRFSNVIKDGLAIASFHAHKFGEPLDTESLNKFAQEKNYPSLQMAYDQWVAPRVEQKRQEEMKAQVQSEIEKGIADYKSKHNLPADPVPQSESYIHHRPAAGSIPSDMGSDADLLNTWRGAVTR